MIQILPSVLAADFLHLSDEILAAEASGIDMHHVDIMDGHFVPNISFGPVIVDSIAKVAKKPLDIHLMISEPSKYLDEYLKVKPHNITIHAEIDENVVNNLKKIQEAGIKAGLSIKPDTSFIEITKYLPYVDVLLIMSVEPGFGGQKFMPEMITKMEEANNYIQRNGLEITLEVDGGITKETAPACIAAGVEMLVAGSSFYGSGDYNQANKDLRGE